MDRDDLMAAMSRELRKHAQVEKELADARRTIERKDRTLMCQSARIINLDNAVHLKDTQIANQRQVIEQWNAGITTATRVTELESQVRAQLLSLSQQEQQLRNQRDEIGKLHSMVSRREFERDEANARNLRQKATIDALETQLKSYQVDSPYLGDVRFGSGQSAAVSEPRQAMNQQNAAPVKLKPIGARFRAKIGSWLMVETTADERREYLKQAQAAGKRIQVWHLNLYRGQRMNEVSSDNGQWDDIRGKTDFLCPAHLYRVHPEDL